MISKGCETISDDYETMSWN